MSHFVNIAVLLALALPVSAFARPGSRMGSPGMEMFMDASEPARGLAGVVDPSVFGAAAAGTTYFGGTVWAADSARWEAIPGQLWTFDTGVGSSIVGQAALPAGWVNPFKVPGYHASMEGWLGIDNTYSEYPYFRRLAASDPRWGPVCVGSAAGLGGEYSFWCGVFREEAERLCYAGGQGYGNTWLVCIEHSFNYTGGGVTLGFKYRNDTEEGWDFTTVYVDTSGIKDDVEAIAYTGLSSGTASVPLTQGIELPVVPKPITIKFCFASDIAWSDEDGLNPSTYGAFAVDDIMVSGGGIAHTATFETGNDGWALSPPAPGPGGDWSTLWALSDLPIPLSPCECALADSVLAFPDDTNGHNLFQNNMAASPWIDLKAAGLTGAPGKLVQTNFYAALPFRDYVFFYFKAQWYPATCPSTGKMITSPWRDTGWVFFRSDPRCTGFDNSNIFRHDLSMLIPPGAEQVRIAVGVGNWCQWYSDCAGTSNSSPWFDLTGLGVYGTPGTPYISVETVDGPQDNFPENGTLHLNAPGRVDRGYAFAWPQGDTLLVRGGFQNSEVYVHFRVTPGPGINVTAFNTWWTRHADSPVEAGFKVARCDTAEHGFYGLDEGSWMTAYHESDPNFTGRDRDVDPTDVAPNGGLWRLANDIFPDDLFTMGTRLDLFYTANLVGSSVHYKTPEGPGVHLEMEILPSSATVDGDWNCVLYVNDGCSCDPPVVDHGLTTVLGTGSGNFEGKRWDRFDVNYESSLGRPLRAENGASVVQLLGYKVVLWLGGHHNQWILQKEDADMLLPWLTLLDFDYSNLYLAGDGIVFDAINRAEAVPSARRLVEDMAGVTLKSTCSLGTYRNAGCPIGGAPEDMTPCVDLEPVPGTFVAGSGPGRSVDHLGQWNGCPGLNSFDVLDVLTPDFGIARGDERYHSAVKSADYASIATDASPSGSLNFKIVVDGIALANRSDADRLCGDTGLMLARTERLGEVLRFFGYGSPANPYCNDPTAGTGLLGDEGRPPIAYRTSLGEFSPNPLAAGAAGRIRFTLAQAGRATLEIYDIQGRRVRTLFDGPGREGPNEVVWNGTDEAGTEVASGVYFYRLRAGGEDLSRRVVVVRRGR